MENNQSATSSGFHYRVKAGLKTQEFFSSMTGWTLSMNSQFTIFRNLNHTYWRLSVLSEELNKDADVHK